MPTITGTVEDTDRGLTNNEGEKIKIRIKEKEIKKSSFTDWTIFYPEKRMDSTKY